MLIPHRLNRIDQTKNQGLYNVTMYDKVTEFLITARLAEDASVKYTISVTGPDNLDKLKTQFNADFDRMATSLRIMGQQMALLNPQSLIRVVQELPTSKENSVNNDAQ